MPVSPEECLALTKEEHDLLARVENYIDNLLLTQYVESGYCVVLTIQRTSTKVYNSIVSDYSSVGWDIKKEIHPNGDFELIFRKGGSR